MARILSVEHARSEYRSLGGAVLAAGVLLMATVGCSEAPVSESPYHDEFTAKLQSDRVSGYQQKVLADYAITDLEYGDARSEFKRCIEAAGFELELLPDGTLMEGVEGREDEADAAFDKCQTEYLTAIEPLYLSIHENPDNADPKEQLLDCLKRAGVVGDKMSMQEFVNQADVLESGSAAEQFEACMHDPMGAFSPH